MRKRTQRVLVATSMHLANDARIVRQLDTLTDAGFECTLVAPWIGAERDYKFKTRFFPRLGGLRGRFLAQLVFFRAALFSRWDVIHFHDFDLTLAAILVRILSWRCVVYDVHENYAEEVMVRGYIPSSIRVPLKHIVNVVEWLACRIIRNLVVVVPVQQERFKRWGCPNIALVRNFAPISFAPFDLNSSHVFKDNGYVLNVGGQTVDYGALMILEAALIIKSLNLGVPLRGIDRFEGSPGLREHVVTIVQNNQLDYLLLPRVGHHQVGDYFKLANIGLSLILDTENKRIAIPTKIFEYMAYGIPIIAKDVGYQAEIIRASGAGLLVPPGDSDALANAILDLWQNDAKRRILGEAGRRAFFSTYCWESEGKELVHFYSVITK